MFFTTQNLEGHEEVSRQDWPCVDADTSHSEESSWEILNDNSSEEALNRYWFKQNYINQRMLQDFVITYQ